MSIRDLSPDRRNRIDGVFAEAMDMDAEQRKTFLDAECRDDPDLRKLVEELLHADASFENDLGTSAAGFAAPLIAAGGLESAADSTSLDTGERVGAWRVIREIGRGGMGTVYLAERADGAFEQRVALKLVKRGMDTDEVLRRFRHERQILASLEHPLIARLYDGGATADGRPYLVMEFVDGEPIDAYCDRHRLDIRARLGVFVRVCEAVQHAHRNLVVHRDLKPSNILVDGAGNPKLLDFGVAKLLADASDADSPDTRTGTRFVTPGYAAPEQIRGEPVTTAVDVYALGVILYRLLTGHRPFSSPSSDPTVERIPTRPSATATSVEIASARSISPEKLHRTLRGELDTILLHALAHDPARRYGSAQEFSEDISRYMRGMPVRAQPDSRWYRTSKFVRRHRLGVATASLFVTALAGFAITVRIQQQNTAIERDKATRERDKAQQVVTFMTGMLADADPAQARGDTLDIFEVLGRARTRMDTALVSQPEVRAEILHVMGRVYRSLGDYTNAQGLLARALATRRQIFGNTHADVAESAHELASVKTIASDYEGAEKLFQEALAARRKLFGETHPSIGVTLHGLGGVYYWKGDHKSAAMIMSQADSVHRRAGSDPLLIATNLSDLAESLRAQNKFDEAEPMMRDGLAIRRKHLGNDHPLTASSMAVLANLLRDKGDPASSAAAEPLYREALEVRRKVLGVDHPDYAKSLLGLAYHLQKLNKYEDAEPLFRQALAINVARHGNDHPEVGLDMNALAKIQYQRGSIGESETTYRQALSILSRTLGPSHPRTSMPQVGLGNVLMAQGRTSEALPLFRQALALRLKEFGPKHRLTTETHITLGDCLTKLRRFEEAEPLLLAAHAAVMGEKERSEARIRESRDRLADFYAAWGKQQKASEYRAD